MVSGIASSTMSSQLTADSAVERLVQQLLDQCAVQQASDLHIEPDQHGYRVRLRLLGSLQPIAHISAQLAPRVLAHIKVLAQLDITERRLPQDGRCRFSVAGRTLDCRVNTTPTLNGEKLVMRMLGAGHTVNEPSEPYTEHSAGIELTAQQRMQQAGLLSEQQQLLTTALAQREGLILTTGPTGSGKTQTLYTLLHALHDDSRNISTVEDPVEVDLAGVNQINVNPAVGFSFAQALRALMRQDPDVIMVGEIRDAETAMMACQAAQTGHLVLATLHASSPLSALIRLQQLGVDGYQLAASLLVLLNQRLVKVTHHGHTQRIGVYEAVAMHPPLRAALLANQHCATYWQDIDAACCGQTTLAEAEAWHRRALESCEVPADAS